MHLLRDLHRLKETHANDAVMLVLAADVRALDDDAQRWRNAHP
jgi:hypothetical protein